MRNKGFTLIELLITIAIIGIVATIAIPNLLTALQKGKLKATMGDMKSVGVALESYMTDYSMAPGGGTLSRIADLNIYLVPFYIKRLPFLDGWGGVLRYQSGAVGPQQELYSVISYGKDRLSTGISIGFNGYLINSMDGFKNDICFANGLFTYAPKIK
jgi:prepilin-type N-terminal cleavage/methylation domain-containing protein